MSSTPECLMECHEVQRLYADGNVAALHGVSLTVSRGEYIAIMGPSGSGKSTLLNLLGGLDRPTSGEIYFQGVPLSNAAQVSKLRIEHVGFIFQSFHLLPTLTAVENVQIPMFEGPLPARARAKKAHELLSLVGMAHRATHLPAQLSGGERQRVAVARALANDPPVLLADEPTGNLDTVTGQELLKLFAQLRRERQMTMIVVTHSPEVAAEAERIIRVRDGRIVEDTGRATL